MAATKGYFALKEECHLLQTIIDTIYPSPLTFAELSVLQSLNQDHYSQELMPSDLTEELIPLKCFGDGNCLFRYMQCMHMSHPCCWEVLGHCQGFIQWGRGEGGSPPPPKKKEREREKAI